MTQNRCFCFMEHPKKNSWMMTGGTPILRKLSHDSRQTSTGWWFGCHDFGIFPEILGFCHHPNWRTHIFQVGVVEKPPTSYVNVYPRVYPWWRLTGLHHRIHSGFFPCSVGWGFFRRSNTRGNPTGQKRAMLQPGLFETGKARNPQLHFITFCGQLYGGFLK